MIPLHRQATAVLLFLALCAIPQALKAQFLDTPQPGSILKEYSRVMTGNIDYRVTDPTVTRPDAVVFLPNPVLSLSIGDLTGAVRAEVIVDHWAGHIGTSNRRIRFNGNSWLSIPSLGAANGIPAGHSGDCYHAQYNPTVQIPLSHLRVGTNTFEGTSGGQICYNFNWGQWGQYGVVVRIYYGSSKPHPTGSITSPGNGTTVSDNPTVNVSTSGSVSEVRVLAYHNGHDPDGDGVRQAYNYAYHRLKTETAMTMKYHVGTDNASPYSLVWNNSLVPDQGGIKFLAMIKGTDGTIFVTNEVTNITLARTGAFVRQYQITDMPERLNVRSGRTTKTVHFTIPSGDVLSNARSATIIIPNWNGNDASEAGLFYTRVNTWTTPVYGADHHWDLAYINVPLSALRQGVNDFTISYTGIHHGIEVMWPGPHVVIRYGGTATNVPPSITQHPQSVTVSAGQTAMFTVGASGTAPLSYQWQKNNTNIPGATGSSYTTPAVTSSDNGSTYRCIVTNPYGNATSNNATLTVGSGNVPPSITQHPQNRSVTVGQTATFSVTAAGTAPLSYQWRKNGANISGATGASYTTPPAALSDNGALFSCFVSNPYGDATSNNATLTVSETPPPPSGNVVQNPGFESGTGSWSFFTNGAGTFASVPPGFEGANAARVAITAEGSNVQLYQSSLNLEPDTEYRLTFQAYSTGARDVAVSLLKHSSPYTNYGLNNDVANLTTGWNEFTFTFRTTGFSSPVSDGRLRFWFAPYDAAGETYFVDAISLAPTSGPPPPPPSSNLLLNPGFEGGTADWSFFTNGDGSFSSVMPGFTGSYSGRVAITTAGTNVQLNQTGFTLQSGARYRLTFSGYSTSGHDVSVYIHQNSAPYADYGLRNAVSALTTRYQTFTREFTAGGFAGTTTDTRLRFWFAPYDAAGDEFFIDDVALEMISPAPAEVSSGSTPESDLEGRTPRNFALGANYPNPFNPSTTIEFGLPEDADVTLAVYNMLGQQVALLASGTHAAGRHSVIWDSRDNTGAQVGSGVYLYRITATGTSGKLYTSLQKMILMK